MFGFGNGFETEALPGALPVGRNSISGPRPDSFGSLLELTWNGREPLKLDGGDLRTFLEDGDTLAIKGFCKSTGYRVDFGVCVGRIIPALPEPDWIKTVSRVTA
jgi:hypothetical protein